MKHTPYRKILKRVYAEYEYCCRKKKYEQFGKNIIYHSVFYLPNLQNDIYVKKKMYNSSLS